MLFLIVVGVVLLVFLWLDCFERESPWMLVFVFPGGLHRHARCHFIQRRRL